MNWQKIEKIAPLAFAELSKYYMEYSENTPLQERIKGFKIFLNSYNTEIYFDDIYGFFDEHRLFCSVQAKQALDDSIWFTGYIFSDIIKDFKITDDQAFDSQSRKETEKKMFFIAFQILNSHLE